MPAQAAFLGQPLPGETPVPFAPALLAPGGQFVQNAAFTSDGKTFFYTVTSARWDRFDLWTIRFEKGVWTKPAPAGFLPGQHTCEPFVAPDGQRLYFLGGTPVNMDIWYCERNGEGWRMAERLPEAINSPGHEWYPSITRKRTLVFARQRQLYLAKPSQGGWSEPVHLGPPVNLPGRLCGDACISPEGDFLIFTTERPGGYGQGDLVISYQKPDGSWTNPKNLGPRINTEAREFAPTLSSDGKYLFFTRRKGWVTDTPSQVWWVRTDFIQALRKTNFAPYVRVPLPDLEAIQGKPLNHAIPEDAFVDDDGNATLAFAATREDGSSLPAWLAFDGPTRTLRGTPKEPGTYRIRLTATDAAGEKASTILVLTVA